MQRRRRKGMKRRRRTSEVRVERRRAGCRTATNFELTVRQEMWKIKMKMNEMRVLGSCVVVC